MEQQEFITRSSTIAYLPARNLIEWFPNLAPTAEDASYWGMRRGETVEIQNKTEHLYPRGSRFQMLQPNGKQGYTAWATIPTDKPIVETLAIYQWTGKKWVEVTSAKEQG